LTQKFHRIGSKLKDLQGTNALAYLVVRQCSFITLTYFDECYIAFKV